MIFYSTPNILAGPLLLFLSLVDLFLCLAAIRLLLGRLRASWSTQLCMNLVPLTDSIPNAVSRRLSRRRTKPVSAWWCWMIFFIGGILLRYLLVWIIFIVSKLM